MTPTEESAAFEAWLTKEEKANGGMGLSQLERDQMLTAWQARAALNKPINMDALIARFPGVKIEIEYDPSEHYYRVWVNDDVVSKSRDLQEAMQIGLHEKPRWHR